MPIQVPASVQANLLGFSYSEDVSTTGDVGITPNPAVGPAKAGSITARTDNDTGTATMTDSGHGIATADVVDVYWVDPTTLANMSRRTMTVGTVSGVSVPLDGGVGDNLPVLNTPLNIAVQHYENLVVTGDNVTAIVLAAGSNRTTFIFRGGSGAEIYAVTLDPNESFVWTDQMGITNPLAGGSVLTMSFSHMSTTDTVNMLGGVTHN